MLCICFYVFSNCPGCSLPLGSARQQADKYKAPGGTFLVFFKYLSLPIWTWLPWRMWEKDAEWSALTIAHCIHGASEPLGMTVAQIYDIPWDWLWDACHMAGVRWGTRCKGFCSKEGPHYCSERSARNLTINLIHEFGNPLGIPCPSCTA